MDVINHFLKFHFGIPYTLNERRTSLHVCLLGFFHCLTRTQKVAPTVFYSRRLFYLGKRNLYVWKRVAYRERIANIKSWTGTNKSVSAVVLPKHNRIKWGYFFSLRLFGLRFVWIRDSGYACRAKISVVSFTNYKKVIVAKYDFEEARFFFALISLKLRFGYSFKFELKWTSSYDYWVEIQVFFLGQMGFWQSKTEILGFVATFCSYFRSEYFSTFTQDARHLIISRWNPFIEIAQRLTHGHNCGKSEVVLLVFYLNKWHFWSCTPSFLFLWIWILNKEKSD